MAGATARDHGQLGPALGSTPYDTYGYGIYVPGGTFQTPMVESMADNLPEDYAKTVAYPWFRKILTQAGAGRGWTWSEVCPDVVVGFTPDGSNFSLELHWAQYLSLYAHNHGISGSSGWADEKVEVSFPGNEGGFDALVTPASSQTLGRVAAYAALNPEKCGGKILNMAGNARPSTFRELWPAIAAWFGLVGVGPSGDDNALKPGEYHGIQARLRGEWTAEGFDL
ncbi:hypothetical protein DL767_001618 [Monosporascus sp. MG133]|nr:hypothetical protein DL767_001618 [Monosporascus sp. MG133]